MPIYEYRCTGCKRKFEQIVLRGKALDEAACPRCGSHEVERLMSPFAVSGVTRKSEESFDDAFDSSEDDFADDLGDDALGGSNEGFGAGEGDDLGGGDDEDDEALGEDDDDLEKEDDL